MFVISDALLPMIGIAQTQLAPFGLENFDLDSIDWRRIFSDRLFGHRIYEINSIQFKWAFG